MKNKIDTNLLIIGSGPAGLTAAVYAARSNLNPILVTGPELGGQISNAKKIDNWPGIVKGISGINITKNLISQVKKFHVNIINDTIQYVDFINKKGFYLCGNNNIYFPNSVIIATGSKPKQLNILNEKKYIGLGLSVCATCDGPFFKNKNIAIVGGGNVAIDDAIFLSDIAKNVKIIHRRNEFKAEKILISQLEKKQKKLNNIDILWNSEVVELIGNNIELTGIKIKNNLLDEYSNIDIDGLFVAIGHLPNSKVFSTQLETTNDYINIGISKEFSTMTNIRGIFAAGDVTDPTYKQAVVASSSGCMSAIDAKKFLQSL